jgi:hypothetical protein
MGSNLPASTQAATLHRGLRQVNEEVVGTLK